MNYYKLKIGLSDYIGFANNIIDLVEMIPSELEQDLIQINALKIQDYKNMSIYNNGNKIKLIDLMEMGESLYLYEFELLKKIK